ncbi:unnamed protein product [Choristocarpus tenellus]
MAGGVLIEQSLNKCIDVFHEQALQESGQTDLPDMAPRRLFGDPLDKDFLAERRIQLDMYLAAILSTRQHWLVENPTKMEIRMDVGRGMMKEMMARQVSGKGGAAARETTNLTLTLTLTFVKL